MDRYIVVSSDCHAGLPASDYRDYLDPQHRETFDMALPIQMDMLNKASECFLIKEVNEQWRQGIETQLTGAWDIGERTKMLDTDGIAAEIIFPDGVTEHNTPPFGAGLGLPTKDIVPELQWAGVRAHNRWLSEFTSAAPERHIGVAPIPLLWDIDEAIKEVRWCVENGIRNVLLPNVVEGFPHYHHTRYHPFWEVCESLGVNINFHSGAAPHSTFFGENFPQEAPDEYPGAMGLYVSEVVFWTYRPVSFLIWGGVFEKFPKLKVAVVEAGTAFMLPSYLRLLDHNYTDVQFSAKLGDFRSHLSMSPSEYFRRNVGIGASCMPRGDAEIRNEVGLEQIMWGSDYPHPEGAWPQTKSQVYDTFHALPDADIAKMLGENAIRFWGLDRDKLAVIAERIGPTREDLKAVL